MSLTVIAEILAGESLVSPGGVVDAATVVADECPLWGQPSSGRRQSGEDAVVALIGAPPAEVAIPVPV